MYKDYSFKMKKQLTYFLKVHRISNSVFTASGSQNFRKLRFNSETAGGREIIRKSTWNC